MNDAQMKQLQSVGLQNTAGRLVSGALITGRAARRRVTRITLMQIVPIFSKNTAQTSSKRHFKRKIHFFSGEGFTSLPRPLPRGPQSSPPTKPCGYASTLLPEFLPGLRLYSRCGDALTLILTAALVLLQSTTTYLSLRSPASNRSRTLLPVLLLKLPNAVTSLLSYIFIGSK